MGIKSVKTYFIYIILMNSHHVQLIIFRMSLCCPVLFQPQGTAAEEHERQLQKVGAGGSGHSGDPPAMKHGVLENPPLLVDIGQYW